jgi:purine nucleosidase
MSLARFVSAFIICCAVAYAATRPVVLTTDCGADMDDQWAIAHVSLSPAFDLRAIVTTHTGKHTILAAPAAEISARNARDVLTHMGRSQVTVIPGSSVALTSRTPLRNAGVERILSESKKFSPDHRLTVLVIGAATDTASALLLDTKLADRIEIIAMGFSSWEKGGHEFNIENDPIAWQVILDSDVPVTVGDGQVSIHDLSLTSERAHALFDRVGFRGRYLAGLLDQWISAHPDLLRNVTGDAKVWPVWDEVTVAYMLGMTKSEQRPRPKMKSDLSFDHSAKHGVITWVTAVDGDLLWSDLGHQLSMVPLNLDVERSSTSTKFP